MPAPTAMNLHTLKFRVTDRPVKHSLLPESLKAVLGTLSSGKAVEFSGLSAGKLQGVYMKLFHHLKRTDPHLTLVRAGASFWVERADKPPKEKPPP